ncbi:MAG: hypothetical protein IH831_09410, partial [Planctomycetes bacterium]|nr:hypothetical protein [Planctomycetota bacterium]
NAVADVAKHRKQIEAENLTEGPEVWALNRAIKRAIKTGSEFGRSPSARRGLRVQITPPSTDPRGRKRKKILKMAEN